jgi:ESCRT-I complex subunit TSG101
MSAPSAHFSLLEQCITRVSFYQNSSRLRQDMQMLFYNCSTLRPNVGTFQSPTGSIVLFYLSGVIPISYNGANYNIPVTIYIDPPYPNQPPRIFVTPTADMMIKPNHKSVDANGRVYLPELTRWNPYSSNLVSIIGILSSVFSSEPPVHAVRSSQQPPQVLTAQVVSPPGMSRRDILINSLTVKLRAKLPAKVKSEVDQLNKAREDENKVRENNTRLKKAHLDLVTLKTRIEAEIETIHALDTQNREWIKKNTRDDESSSSNSGMTALSFLEAESAVGQQVIDLMAEECAHEDLIDYLCTLNREGKLSMSDLLKEIRILTRKIFEIRTLKRRALVVLQSAPQHSGNILKVPAAK